MRRERGKRKAGNALAKSLEAAAASSLHLLFSLRLPSLFYDFAVGLGQPINTRRQPDRHVRNRLCNTVLRNYRKRLGPLSPRQTRREPRLYSFRMQICFREGNPFDIAPTKFDKTRRNERERDSGEPTRNNRPIAATTREHADSVIIPIERISRFSRYLQPVIRRGVSTSSSRVLQLYEDRSEREQRDGGGIIWTWREIAKGLPVIRLSRGRLAKPEGERRREAAAEYSSPRLYNLPECPVHARQYHFNPLCESTRSRRLSTDRAPLFFG